MAPVWHSVSVGLSQLLCSPWKGFSAWCWGQMALPLTLWVQSGPCGPMDGTQSVVATRGPVLALCPMCGMDTWVMRLLWEVNGSDERVEWGPWRQQPSLQLGVLVGPSRLEAAMDFPGVV